jgi:tetratricopeptide (TPR) repeat protein
MSNYTSSREGEVLALGDDIAAKILKRSPRHYGALLVRAMGAFEPGRNAESALAFLRKCRNRQDGTWRYSVAFLLAYQGELDQAVREYERAFATPTRDVTVPLQSEEFIHGVLRTEPDKYQLHFCSALINERAKRDSDAALNDYRTFVGEAGDRAEFAQQVAIAKLALDRLQRGDVS